MSNVLKLDEYHGRELVDLSEFSKSECEKHVRENVNGDWVDDFDDDDDNNYDSYVMVSVIEYEKLNLIIVTYKLFCMDDGETTVECEFININP